MKVLRSWLEEFGKIKLSDDELALRLANTGTEVEAVIKLIDDKIIAAEIIKINKHPNADRLSLVVVSDGQNNLEVVCGATNIKVGQRVPLAPIGARIGDQVIEQTNIRGSISNGMLCSEFELGIGDGHEEIKILSDDVELGEKLSRYFSTESLFDLEITPNRGDCLSHLGMAREIAAVTNSSIRREPVKLTMDSKPANSEIQVEIQSKKQCSQYLARVIKGVKVSPSPEWLASKLEKLGLKPINNIVDITNYIMYDLGQPLHAFDGDQISGGKIIVRTARKGESIVTLDNKERLLSETDLVIADKKLAIAIAGVMGGKDSEIDDSTTDVIIEAAVFDRRSVRKTARKLGAVTDASYRFERGIDEMGVEYAINKAAFLIKEIAGGAILSGIVKQEEPGRNESLEIRYAKINLLLGLNLSDEEINSLLRRLGFEINGNNCKIPSWRHDIFTWHDLAEEVGRLHGYDKIPLKQLPKVASSHRGDYYLKESLKDSLVDYGFTEVINYPFLSGEEAKLMNIDTNELLEIANPIQPENMYLRNNLVNGLLKTIAKNSAFTTLAVFEIGQVFFKTQEETHLAVAVAGKDLKSTSALISGAQDSLAKLVSLDSDSKVVSLDDSSLKSLKIRKTQTMYFEISLSKIFQKHQNNKSYDLKISKDEAIYRPVSRFPSSTRDLAFVVDCKIEAEDIVRSIYNYSENINLVKIFDEFTSDKFGKNKKNLAFHLFIQDINKTLSHTEVDQIIKGIVTHITKNFSADLRA